MVNPVKDTRSIAPSSSRLDITGFLYSFKILTASVLEYKLSTIVFILGSLKLSEKEKLYIWLSTASSETGKGGVALSEEDVSTFPFKT